MAWPASSGITAMEDVSGMTEIGHKWESQGQPTGAAPTLWPLCLHPTDCHPWGVWDESPRPRHQDHHRSQRLGLPVLLRSAAVSYVAETQTSGLCRGAGRSHRPTARVCLRQPQRLPRKWPPPGLYMQKLPSPPNLQGRLHSALRAWQCEERQRCWVSKPLRGRARVAKAHEC